jgi:uncharacterized protein YqeY
MSNSADQISEDIKTAMRAKDSIALKSLRALTHSSKDSPAITRIADDNNI